MKSAFSSLISGRKNDSLEADKQTIEEKTRADQEQQIHMQVEHYSDFEFWVLDWSKILPSLIFLLFIFIFAYTLKPIIFEILSFHTYSLQIERKNSTDLDWSRSMKWIRVWTWIVIVFLPTYYKSWNPCKIAPSSREWKGRNLSNFIRGR